MRNPVLHFSRPLVELNRSIPEIGIDLRPKTASAVSSLFYIDTVDMPEFTTVVDMAVKVVAGMGAVRTHLSSTPETGT